MIETWIHLGKGYFANQATGLINFEAPGACLQLPAFHQLMNDIMRVADRAVLVAELNAGRVFDVAGSVSQFERIDRHQLIRRCQQWLVPKNSTLPTLPAEVTLCRRHCYLAWSAAMCAV